MRELGVWADARSRSMNAEMVQRLEESDKAPNAQKKDKIPEPYSYVRAS